MNMKCLVICATILNIHVRWSASTSIFGSDQTCKIQIENNQAELKTLLEKQNQFNLNNWSHIAKLIIIGILIVLLSTACCYIQVKFWKLVKATQQNQTGQKEEKSRPFIIYSKDRSSQFAKEIEAQEV